MKLQKINIKSLPTPIVITGGAALAGAIVAGAAFALYRDRKHKKEFFEQLEKHMKEDHWNAMIEDHQSELKDTPLQLDKDGYIIDWEK